MQEQVGEPLNPGKCVSIISNQNVKVCTHNMFIKHFPTIFVIVRISTLIFTDNSKTLKKFTLMKFYYVIISI